MILHDSKDVLRIMTTHYGNAIIDRRFFGENESRKEDYYIRECSSKSSKRSCEDADQITIFELLVPLSI